MADLGLESAHLPDSRVRAFEYDADFYGLRFAYTLGIS